MAVRVEFTRPIEISEAAYWLAYRCRRDSTGYVARLGERDVYAWPHQTVEEIVRTHVRLGELAYEISRGGRWVLSRKRDLLRLIRLEMVDRATAMAEFRLSDAELCEWDATISTTPMSAAS